MRALILDPEQRTAEVCDVPKPNPSRGEVLIKVEYVALNPVDSLYVAEPLATSRRVLGSDFAGHIVEIGPDVGVDCGLKQGDRVAGFVQGASSVNERPGAFAEYVVSPWDLLWKVPDGMSLDGAATLSLCALTAAQALFCRMSLPSPWEESKSSSTWPSLEPQYFLVYGASTSVGLFAAQLLQQMKEKLDSKVVLIGVASKKQWEMLKAPPYSYDHLLDYRDPDWLASVETLISGKGLRYAYDCISEGDTVAKISSIMQPTGQLMVVRSIQGGAWTVPQELKVEPSYGAVWEGLGEEVQYKGMNLPANPKARASAVDFYRWLSSSKAIQPSRVRLMPGGLNKIAADGFELLGSGTMDDRLKRDEEWMKPISAEKLVYRLW
jgi:NADPH:quinone reductase-like Zn-dependent oxidoreductase